MSLPTGFCFRAKACAAVALLAGGLLMTAAPAQAFWSSDNTPSACAAMSDRFDVPGLWLGHFSGGRLAFRPNGDKMVDWNNSYQCFASARQCHAWRSEMRRLYAHYQGYGACIALRGGGRPLHYRDSGISVRY